MYNFLRFCKRFDIEDNPSALKIKDVFDTDSHFIITTKVFVEIFSIYFIMYLMIKLALFLSIF